MNEISEKVWGGMGEILVRRGGMVGRGFNKHRRPTKRVSYFAHRGN